MVIESRKEDGKPAQQWYWDDWFSEFGLRLCSLEARGLWIDMLGIMFKAEIRGTLTVNGRQIDSKGLAKIVNAKEEVVNRCLKELETNDVFSRLDDKTIISRRMYRESKRKEEISKIKAKAGRKGAKKRWQEDGRPITEPKQTDSRGIKKSDGKRIAEGSKKSMAKMAASTSSSTSSSTPIDISKDISDVPSVDNSKLKELKDKVYKTGFNIYQFENKLKKEFKTTLPDEVLIKVYERALKDKPNIKDIWPWLDRVLKHEIAIFNARAEEAKTAKFKSEPVKIGNILSQLAAKSSEK